MVIMAFSMFNQHTGEGDLSTHWELFSCGYGLLIDTLDTLINKHAVLIRTAKWTKSFMEYRNKLLQKKYLEEL